MSTVWSASSGYMFIGVGLEWSGDPSSGSVTVTATVTACSDGYGHSFSSAWSWWGYYGSGSEGFSFSSGYGQTVYKQLSQWSFTVPLEYGREKTVTIGASLGPIWNGGNPSVENTLTLPARPVELPNAPTKVTASRVSDQQINIEWVAPASGESNPIDYFVVERRLDESDQWTVVAPVKDAVSFADMDVKAGHKYSYRVKSDNMAGGSEYVEAERPVFTTPPAPVNVRAVKDASGNIVVSWENRAPYTPTRWEVYDGDNLAALVTLGVEKCVWEHSSPRLDVTHQYRVVCVGGSMSSARSEPSNVVQLLARPNAPEPTVDGLYFPADEPVTLGWLFNATDSSPQTRFKLQYMRRLGGVQGPLFDQATSKQEWTVGVLSQGTYEYWVQTWGLHADPSPVSRRALFYVETRPAISIQSPGQVVKTSFIDVAWAYSPMGGPVQTKAIVELYQGDSQLVETQVARGSQASVRLKTYLKNGLSYRVSVTAVNAHDVKSKTVSQTFQVEYEQPPAPRVYPEWDDEVGCVRVRVVNPTPEAGKPAAVRNRVERSDDGGMSWTILTEDLPVSGMILDYQSPSHGSVSYRVTATSDLPSSSTMVESIDTQSWAMWIGGGWDFSTTVPLRWDPVHSCKMGLAHRKLHRFAGRERAVEMSGRHREKTLSLSAALFDEDFPLIQRLEELSYLPAPFLYRDPMGRVVYCSIASVSVDRALSGKWSVKIEVEEVDHE
nr:MAG TPA: FN3 [Caudoviricetes sp.]